MGGRAGGGASGGMGSGSRGMSDSAIERLASSQQRFGLNDLNATMEPKLLSGEWLMTYSHFTADGKTTIMDVKNAKIDNEVGSVVSSFPTVPKGNSTKAKVAYLKSYNEWASKSQAAYDKAIAGYKSEIGKTKNKAAKYFFAKHIQQMKGWKSDLAKDTAWTNKVYSKYQ